MREGNVPIETVTSDSNHYFGLRGMATPERRKLLIGAVLTIFFSAIFVIWMSLGAYQSHYLSALRTLGDFTTTTIIGHPKEGRGDEWATYLPMLKQAYHEGFPYRSTLAPYRERLEWFISLPHWDLSLVFLPNQLAYWTVSGARALSFQGFYYNALLIASFIWLLVNLGVRVRFAFSAAFVLLFSQFYQVWWTSNFPALAVAFLPFAIYTSRLKPVYKFASLFWALAHLLLGQMYPPFYIALAFGVAPVVAAIKPEILTPRSIFLAAAATICALVVYLALKLDFVLAVSGTTYPGHRLETGGTSSASTLLGIIFPTYPSRSALGVGDTVHELSVVGTFFSIILLAILPTVKWDRPTIRVTLVTAAVSIFLSIYMLWGFPPFLSRITGFSMMPGRRAQLGLSVLALIYSVFILSKNFSRLRAIPLIASAVMYAAISLFVGPRADLEGNFFCAVYYPYILFALVVLGYATSLILPKCRPAALIAGVLIVGMTISHIVIFGSFNPIMRARDIVAPVDSQIIRDWKYLFHMNSDRPIAIIGNYGHLLRGEGLPALEAIHLANVDEDVYRKVFPELTAGDFQSLFNQFRGIAFDNIPKFETRDLMVFFPTEGHAVSFPHQVVYNSATESPPANRINTKIMVGDKSTFEIYWNSTLTHASAGDVTLSLPMNCPVIFSWLTRYPVSMPGAPLVAVALPGVAGHLTVTASTEAEAERCASLLRVSLDSGHQAKPEAAGSDEQGFAAENPVPTMDENIRRIATSAFASDSEPALACSLDTVDGNYSKQPIELRRGSKHVFQGWLLDEQGMPATTFDVLLTGDESFVIQARAGSTRNDVAEYFRNQMLAKSGFNLSTNVTGIADGEYAISLLIVKGNHVYRCRTGRSVTVK